MAEVIKTLEDLIDYFAPPSQELGTYVSFDLFNLKTDLILCALILFIFERALMLLSRNLWLKIAFLMSELNRRNACQICPQTVE